MITRVFLSSHNTPVYGTLATVAKACAPRQSLSSPDARSTHLDRSLVDLFLCQKQNRRLRPTHQRKPSQRNKRKGTNGRDGLSEFRPDAAVQPRHAVCLDDPLDAVERRGVRASLDLACLHAGFDGEIWMSVSLVEGRGTGERNEQG